MTGLALADRPSRAVSHAGAWALACLAASLLATFAFACASPLAGLAAIVGLNLPRRQAFAVAGSIWLANQAIGFLFLHYPLTVDCFAWGAALGAATLFAAAAGVETQRIAQPMLRLAGALIAGFVVYQFALFSVTPILGGESAFAFDIVLRIFAINAAAFLVLAALHAIVAAVENRRTVALSPAPL